MRRVINSIFIACALLAIYQGDANTMPEGVESQQLAEQETSRSTTLFEQISPTRSGVNFVNPLVADHKLRRLYSSGFACGGIAVGDVNGDGRTDLFLTNGATPNRLYLQSEGLKFKEATKTSGLALGNPWSGGASFADIDGDGDLDLLLCNYEAPNQLFLNNGSGKFTEEAKQRGLALSDSSLMGYFCDYDLDGDLDLYVQCNRLYREGGRPQKPPFEMVNNQPQILPQFRKYFGFERIAGKFHKIITVGRPDHLYRNNGKGFFTDVTTQSGISDIHRGLSATWYDYNEDGYPDLFVANDMNDVDQFYRNNGDGTFTDVTQSIVPHTTWFSMGADIADINNDGLIDYFCVDMAGTNHFLEKTTMGVMNDRKWFVENNVPTQYMWNTLFLNTGTGRFLEAAYLANVAKSDWSWAPKFADFDNDGWTDLYVTNGMSRNFTHSDMPLDEKWLIGREEFDIYRNTPPKKDRNLALRNDGNLHFSDTADDWGLAHYGISFAAATADLDRDGSPDLIVANQDEPVHIYRNTSRGNRVTLRLQGLTNHYGIGAKVDIQTEAGLQTRYHNPYTGYLSSNEPILHFGLGKSKRIQKMTIHWPGGTKQVLQDLPANRHFTIHEPKARVGPQRPPEPSAKPIFTKTTLHAVRHKEANFEDYERQPLLPYKHSQLGPATAIGDLDGDGLEDFFFGGASGQAATILIGLKTGQLSASSQPALEKDKMYEDMGALFFDADSDGDADLYVASGSVECEPNDEVLQDRLYINDGKGSLTKAPDGIIPSIHQSSSIVAACDFDRDGDLDLFVGSRVIPGKYPLPPDSHLYLNDKGKFTPAKAEVPQTFPKLGLVTSALWSDADLDGWPDLFVTTEWGPIHLYLNKKGNLIEATQDAGLSKHTGWWNGITARDIDNDGDIDYAVSNFGLNTKYHIKPGKPVVAFYGQFTPNGRAGFVEALWEGNTLYPVRGKSCSTDAFPHLGQKYKKFVEFAKATLPQIYTRQCLDDAHEFEAAVLESGILLNNGSAKFTFEPLPRLAQIAPSFGIGLTEINGDGKADLYLLQNFFGNQHETGRMDGGVSLLLRGNGDGTFQPIWPKESGLIHYGDAKALATTDLNRDGKPDFITTANNANPIVFLNQGTEGTFTLRLQGSKGNPTAIGARVVVSTEDGLVQTDEVRAGSSYLAQSSPALQFSSGKSDKLKEIKIFWPDGQLTEKSNITLQKFLIIER